MAQHYGITSSQELFGLSWRRFTVLARHAFRWSDEDPGAVEELRQDPAYEKAVEGARGAEAKIARSIDWDGLAGRPKAESKRIVTTGEFMKGMRRNG